VEGLNPGPGNYDLKLETGKSFKFGRDDKLKTSKSFTPGPGQYQIPCSIAHVPVYTVGKFSQDFKYV
jgi:hypothetical protein